MTTKPVSQIGSEGQHPRLTWLPDPPISPDMQEQFPYISRAYVILEDHFRSRPDVFVGGEGYLCYAPSDTPNAPKPDCMVATGLEIPPAEITESNGYAISEIGKPPDFVLEVASKSTGRRDYIDKRSIHAGYRVAEYWRFDHTGGRYHDAALAGDRLVGNAYEPIEVVRGTDGVIRAYSASLGLELHWDDERLRFWDPDAGEYLPELTEVKAQRDAAIAQRDAAVERIRQLEEELARRQSGG